MLSGEWQITLADGWGLRSHGEDACEDGVVGRFLTGGPKRLSAAQAEQANVRVDLRPSTLTASTASWSASARSGVLLAATINGGYFDGYQAFRLKDVDRVRRGLELRGPVRPNPPGVAAVITAC